jgi:nicotinamidase-related amidase
MNTLLVIDMQNAWINENPRFDIIGVIARINQVAQHFRTQGNSVIFIRHSDDEVKIGSTGWQVHADLATFPSDIFIDKTACDSFSNTTLLDQLQGMGTTNITICGLATEFCVDTTLRAALSHGFDVLALTDAHTTANRDHLSAKEIIDHHNWIWTHLAAPSGRHIDVKSCRLAFSNQI